MTPQSALLSARLVSENYFEVLGISAVLCHTSCQRRSSWRSPIPRACSVINSGSSGSLVPSDSPLTAVTATPCQNLQFREWILACFILARQLVGCVYTVRSHGILRD